jgi:hypothetical protein
MLKTILESGNIRETLLFLEKFEVGDYKISELEVGQGTKCRQSGRYAGVSIGRDKKGYFCFTHRARSESYPSVADIPESKIKRVRSTG